MKNGEMVKKSFYKWSKLFSQKSSSDPMFYKIIKVIKTIFVTKLKKI